MTYVFEYPDDVYWAHGYFHKEVDDDYVHIKERRCKPNKPPYMNSDLRKAVYTR